MFFGKECRMLLRLGALVFLAVTLVGCGSMRKFAAQTNAEREAVSSYVFTLPAGRVWSEMKAMFAQTGVDVTDDAGEKGDGMFLATTAWQASGFDNDRFRHTLRGTKVENGFKIEITKISQQYTQIDRKYSDPTSFRDIKKELQVIKRLDPKAADEIAEKARLAGENAQ